jgi:hypothetical protein
VTGTAGASWQCGGCCGALVPREQVCCPPCWDRAPRWLRERYRDTRDADPWTVLGAGVDLLRWYRAHPLRSASGGARRGTCPTCRLDVLLRLDNTLRRHGGGGHPPCEGSHQMPLCTVA